MLGLIPAALSRSLPEKLPRLAMFAPQLFVAVPLMLYPMALPLILTTAVKLGEPLLMLIFTLPLKLALPADRQHALVMPQQNPPMVSVWEPRLISTPLRSLISPLGLRVATAPGGHLSASFKLGEAPKVRVMDPPIVGHPEHVGTVPRPVSTPLVIPPADVRVTCPPRRTLNTLSEKPAARVKVAALGVICTRIEPLRGELKPGGRKVKLDANA